MGQDLIHQEEETAAQQKTDRGGNVPWHAHILRHCDRRRQQRPEAGRDHHPAGKTEHCVESTAGDFARQENPGGAQSGHCPGKQSGQEGL